MYEIPIFPLNTVLFPGIPLHLHIFETRYRLMIKECLESDRPFGVVLIRNGDEANGPLAETYSVGTTARIVEVNPLPDGRMNITAMGDERFIIAHQDDHLPYRTAGVESIPLEISRSLALQKPRRQFTHLLETYLSLIARTGGMGMDLQKMELPEEPLLLVYLATALLQIPPAEKQPLLEAMTSRQLVFGALRLLRREVALQQQVTHVKEESAARAAWLN